MLPDSVQANSHFLRNVLCRLETPDRQARVSGHLRNVAVCEALALIGFLDGHPDIKGRPSIQRGPAAFQQQTGTVDNPFCHVAPSNLVLGGVDLGGFFALAANRALVARIFGMGVNAPDNWAELHTFATVPAQQNRADNISERHASTFGLVAAFEGAAQAAATEGRWDGTGRRRFQRPALVDFVRRHYEQVWRPGATGAYDQALMHLQGKLAAAVQGRQAAALARLNERIAIVTAQRDQLVNDQLQVAGAVALTLDSAEKEVWPQQRARS